MNFSARVVRGAVWFIATTVLVWMACDEHIIQRAASDYFQYEPGNWWQLIGAADTMYVEVEIPDTVDQIEVFPVTFNGLARLMFEGDDALYEHVRVVYAFSGSEYQVIDDFIARVELPLVNGNTWHDSLVGSIEVAGQDVSAWYHVHGSITGCQYSASYDGDVYAIEIVSCTQVVTPDTTINDTVSVREEYAPGLGIIRLQDRTGDYLLSDYLVQ